jgi:hypothetical protein
MSDPPVFGSVFHHELTIRPALNKRRRCWECKRDGVKRAATHVGCANGLAMANGCEWHMRKWMQETLKMRRALPPGALDR